MGYYSGLIMCSGLSCRNLFHLQGGYDYDEGEVCEVCELYQEHDYLHRKLAAQFNLLASARSTSPLVHLFRAESLLHLLADMSSGTLESAMQKYLVCLQRRNLKLILTGSPYGFRPVFLRLAREWCSTFRYERDCLDLVLDFLRPSDELRG